MSVIIVNPRDVAWIAEEEDPWCPVLEADLLPPGHRGRQRSGKRERGEREGRERGEGEERKNEREKREGRKREGGERERERAWRDRVSTGTGWPGVSILCLCEIESLISNFYLSVAAHTMV